MSEISTYKLIKEKLQAIPNQRLKGSWFEKVSKRFLKEHDSADEYESIDLWSDWELNNNERDRGIDIVITTTSKEYIAVQCKFHQDSVSWNDISTFAAKLQSGVGEIGFKKGIIISTSNLSSNALEEIEQIRKSKGIDIVEISEEDFIYSQIDWEKFDPTQTQGELPLCDKKKPRPHQIKENDLISDEALKEKFLNNLFAFDIVLLAYYIALINITQAVQNRDGSLKTFKNIALTDSLDFYEEKNDKGVFDLFKDLEENKEIKSTIEKQNIRVIIGNPPYSAGAKSQNDNNQNLSHPKLEKRVYEKYGQISTAKVGATTRDTLIQSIYMASELLKDRGVLGFVVNGGFIDSKSGDGFRKCVAKEFAHLYVLNLRGNARTSGETFKKEGGKIFDSGSRATIAIIFFVKDTSVKNSIIHYYDIGDYLKREEKLNRLAHFTNLDAIPFETIIPNNKGDWINQRDGAFDKLIPLKRDKKLQNPSVFDINSNGVASGRDPWVYNFSKDALMRSVQKCIDTYNADLKRFNAHFREAFKQRTKGVKSDQLYKHLNDKEITTDKTKIAWTDGLKNNLIKNKNLQESHEKRIRLAMYRPFNKQWLYWDKDWINRQFQLPKIFPDKDAQNVVINTGVGNGKDFSALVSDCISDYVLISPNQAYPLYYYDDWGNRHYAISGYALNLFRKHYDDNLIAEEEIFYYIYAILHHKGYLEKYKN
ncbi:type ISP restriction/modification enzyme, partial [Helicobacter pylori]|uniref:type ISP restriction/modification enzyme n=1 Tax=Helicobacter pylori TaxID=210 RepID=UPI0039DFD16A